MLNLEEWNNLISEAEKNLAKLPQQHKAFMLGIQNEIKERVRKGKPCDDIIERIKNYANNEQKIQN